MDLLATGRSQASRNLVAKLTNMVRDAVKANLNDFRKDGMRFTELV